MRPVQREQQASLLGVSLRPQLCNLRGDIIGVAAVPNVLHEHGVSFRADPALRECADDLLP